MWRPKENWDAKEIAGSVKVPKGFLGLELYVEAGADAMLEALKRNGKRAGGKAVVSIEMPNPYGEKGYLVFIPEEK